MSEHDGKYAKGMVIGLVAGLLAGVLLAPKSGKETREDIKNVAKEAAKKTEAQLKKIHVELSDLVSSAEEQFRKMSASAKDEAKSVLASAKKSRDQLANTISAVKDGSSDDEDLDIAVKNAQSAMDSLKKYFKK
jgi:gas vesicle protein